MDAEHARKLTDDYRLYARSTREVWQALREVEDLIADDDTIRFAGRRPKANAILNALVLHVRSLPPHRQRSIVADGLAKLDELLRRP